MGNFNIHPSNTHVPGEDDDMSAGQVAFAGRVLLARSISDREEHHAVGPELVVHCIPERQERHQPPVAGDPRESELTMVHSAPSLAQPDDRPNVSGGISGNAHERPSRTSSHFVDVATTVRKFVHSQRDARKWCHQRVFKTPRETVDALVAGGLKKTLFPVDRLLMLAILAGVFVAVGGSFALSMRFGLDPTASWTLQRLTLGICFSTGLFLIIMVGGELFTGNTMFLIIALLQKKISVWGLFYNWTVVYFGNWMGAVFGAFFLCWLPGIFATDPWLSGIQALTVSKVSMNFGQMFVRAICANFLVCIAIFLATAAEDVSGKVFGAAIPIVIFASVGYEHSIANMFYCDLGLMLGAPVSFWEILWKNLLLVTLGNIVGGAIGVGACLWFLYHGFPWEDMAGDNLRQRVWFSFQRR
jgi:formate/nitrite transporter